jgi:hypothetical protein
MAPEPFSAAYFINPSDQSVCLYVYPLSLQGNGSTSINILSLLGNGSEKHYRANEYATVEELLDV